MMIPNLIGVVALMPLVAKITKNYVNRKIKGLDEEEIISYDPTIAEEMKNHGEVVGEPVQETAQEPKPTASRKKNSK